MALYAGNPNPHISHPTVKHRRWNTATAPVYRPRCGCGFVFSHALWRLYRVRQNVFPHCVKCANPPVFKEASQNSDTCYLRLTLQSNIFIRTKTIHTRARAYPKPERSMHALLDIYNIYIHTDYIYIYILSIYYIKRLVTHHPPHHSPPPVIRPTHRCGL